uniref:Uncharacterized protein n=1 Tax=Athene cunicularia TaxID=194338 RepID=A0A663MKJ8_ATHCN
HPKLSELFLNIHIFIYMYVMCFTSGFKRGADPGMPEPTIWRYVSVPNVHANSVQVLTGLGVTSGQQQLGRLLPSIVFNCAE